LVFVYFYKFFKFIEARKGQFTKKDIFKKLYENCMFLAAQETYGMVKKGCKLVTCKFFYSIFYGDYK